MEKVVRNVIKAGAALALSICSTAALADPTVFNLELGTTTEGQMKAIYAATHTGTNKYSNGNMYSIPTRQVDFAGVKEVTVIFDTDGVLVAVLSTLPKSKFSYLNGILDGKYRRIKQNVPFVGNKSATYRDGGTEISIDAPHMSFDMSMNYIRDDLLSAFRRQRAAEEREKRSNEASQL